jgi:predicted site-specific integrase-resolvase
MSTSFCTNICISRVEFNDWGRAMRVAIYLRVSTSDQTTDNQRRELEAVASRHSWSVVRVFEDSGILWRQGP